MNSLNRAVMRLPPNGYRSINSVTRANGRLSATLIQPCSRSHFHSLLLREPRPEIEISKLFLRSKFLPEDIRGSAATLSSRGYHATSRVGQEDKSRQSTASAESESAKKDNDQESTSEENSKQEKENKEGEDKKKEDAPPPPPHGDKSPWQVFTETLQKEFKASKEWNESTKAIAGGVQQFTENESVRKARQAYEQTTDTVASGAAKVLKTTAGAVGKGAAWTWETPVVKGVRSTVNATASVIEKGTRPLRETEAYKNVKNVIDDGSSSRYGGWVEKEERRKARERREREEAAARGLSGGRVEVPQEDPK